MVTTVLVELERHDRHPGAGKEALSYATQLLSTNQPIRAPRSRADDALRAAVIAERLTGGLDPARDRGVRDDPAVPDLLDDLVLRDHALPVLHQEHQEGEDLRLDVNKTSVPPQLDLRG